MTGKIDVFEVMKALPWVTHHSSENDPTACTLITFDPDTIKKQISKSVEILLQEGPEITCSFTITFSPEQKFRAGIQFKSKEPYSYFQYKASLYERESFFSGSTIQYKFNFLEDLSMRNIKKESIFYFSRPINPPYLLFQISRIGEQLTPMQIEIPENEMIKDLSLLLKNKRFTDVKIVCQDQEFSAHKLLLAARSSVFQAMFEHKMKESQENKIKITDIEPEILEHLLRFIYTDTVEDLKEGQAEKLLAAADKYALENLKLICMKEIAKSVKDVDKAFEVLAIVERYNVPGFRDIVFDFAKKKLKKS